MSEAIRSTLHALKDVQGIQGSFVLNGDGTLIAMEMPPIFGGSVFQEVGPRISRLADTFASIGDDLESCILRFSDHLLCVRQIAKGGALCILTNAGVNLPALKMAVNLAHRRVSAEMASPTPAPMPVAPTVATMPRGVTSSPVAELSPAQASAPTFVPSDPPAAPERKRARYYRGQLIED